MKSLLNWFKARPKKPSNYQLFTQWFGGEKELKSFTSEELVDGMTYAIRAGRHTYWNDLYEEGLRRRKQNQPRTNLLG